MFRHRIRNLLCPLHDHDEEENNGNIFKIKIHQCVREQKEDSVVFVFEPGDKEDHHHNESRYYAGVCCKLQNTVVDVFDIVKTGGCQPAGIGVAECAEPHGKSLYEGDCILHVQKPALKSAGIKGNICQSPEDTGSCRDQKTYDHYRRKDHNSKYNMFYIIMVIYHKKPYSKEYYQSDEHHEYGTAAAPEETYRQYDQDIRVFTSVKIFAHNACQHQQSEGVGVSHEAAHTVGYEHVFPQRCDQQNSTCDHGQNTGEGDEPDQGSFFCCAELHHDEREGEQTEEF